MNSKNGDPCHWAPALGLAAAMAMVIGSGVAAASPADSCVGDPLTGERVALVIGVTDYGLADQISGVKDAQDMACALKKLGFTVVGPLPNADIHAISTSLDDFGTKIAQAKVALFYFSGHGAQEGGENYLVPKAASYTLKGLLALSTVLRTFGLAERTDAKKIVLLDACRTSTIQIDGKAPSSPGLTKVDSNSLDGNTIIGLASLPGLAAASGKPDANSPYTSVLLSHLLEPGLSLGAMLGDVTSEVEHAAGSDQTPFVEGGEGFASGFFLRPAVVAKVKINQVDDDLKILVQDHETLTLNNKPQNTEATLTLQARDNQVEVRVFNNPTYRDNNALESAEGWNYSLILEDAAGKPLGGTLADGEDAVYKDGPHFGKWFTVARANLYVYPDAATATLELRDPDGGVAKREGGPLYELDQAFLCKIKVPGLFLRPGHENLFLVGGAKRLQDKARGCFSAPGVIPRVILAILSASPKLASDPAALSQAIAGASGACTGDHLWFALEDHAPGELSNVPDCG